MKNSERRLKSLLLLPLLAGAFALSACGEEEVEDGGTASIGGPDPRELVPADAPVYFEAVVDPDSDQAEDLNAAVERVSGVEDAVGMIEAEIESGLEAEGTEISYGEDIEPLLGNRAGFFISDFPEGFSADGEELEFNGAAVIATTDPEAALELIKSAITDSGKSFEDVSYGDVDYIVDPEESSEQRGAAGIIGDFVVLGTEPALQGVVDAQDGENLAGDEAASGDLDALDASSLLSGRFDFGSLFEAATSSEDITPEQLEAIEAYFDGPVEGSGTFAVGAGEDSFSAEFSAPASLQPGYAAGSESIESLPADAWLAFAATDVGAALSNAFSQFEDAISVQGLDGAELSPDAIEDQLGLDPGQDLGWIGDVRGFVAGESFLGLGAGLAIEATDEAAATEALKAVARAFRGQALVEPIDGGFRFSPEGAPVSASLVLREGQLILAAGAVDEEDVLNPAETLADSDSFNDAVGALGEDYATSFFVDLETIQSLAESVGDISADPSLGIAIQYLANLDYFIVGSQADEETITAKIRLGLRDGSSSDAESAAITP